MRQCNCDPDAPPARLSATLRVLTKTGLIGLVVLLAGFARLQAGVPVPANDNFADASGVAGLMVTTNSSTVGATLEGIDEPDHAGNTNAPSVWFRWQAPQDGWVSMTITNLSGPLFDSILAVYTGNALGSLSPVAADPGGTNGSQVAFSCDAGEEYHVAVAGANNTFGDFSLTISQVLAPTLTMGLAPPGGFAFRVEGTDGASYVVEASTNLTDWSAIGTNTAIFTNVDATVTEYPQRFFRARYSPAGSGSGSNPRDEVLAFFDSIEGQHTVSAQQTSTGLREINDVEDATGIRVGMAVGDYYPDGDPFESTTNEGLIQYWNDGGLVGISIHMRNPATGGDSWDTSINANDLLNPSSQTHAQLLSNLDDVADALEELEDAGVAVLFRPWHEQDGGWFWWGSGRLTEAQFRQLWILTYNHMNDRGLDQLIWVFGTNGNNENRYPGDNYVDIISFDRYSSNPSGVVPTYDRMVSNFDKPVAFAEFGSGSPSAPDYNFDAWTLIDVIKNDMPNLLWVNPWTGWGWDTMRNAGAALSDPRILNLGDFVAHSSGTSNPVNGAAAVWPFARTPRLFLEYHPQ